MSTPIPPKPSFSKANPEQKPKALKAIKEPNAWDRPPWPKVGDEQEITVFTAVGRALTARQGLENNLATLFSRLTSPTVYSEVSHRAFSAIRTHEARIAMLLAAGEVFFYEFSDKGITDEFKTITGQSLNWSQRRNEIAHGMIAPHYNRETAAQKGLCLMPSFANSKDWKFRGNASFCYVGSQIDNMALGLGQLSFSTFMLDGKLFVTAQPTGRMVWPHSVALIA